MGIWARLRDHDRWAAAALAGALSVASTMPARAQTETQPPTAQAQPDKPDPAPGGAALEKKDGSQPAPGPAPAALAPAPTPASTPVPPSQPSQLQNGTPATVVDSHEVDGILGKPARSPTGEDMGRIVDLIVDRSGQVRAAIIDFGGFLGVGSRKIAVDWRAVRFNGAGKTDYLVFDLTRNQLRMAPAYVAGEPVVVIGPQQEARPQPPAAPPAAAAPAPAPPSTPPPQTEAPVKAQDP